MSIPGIYHIAVYSFTASSPAKLNLRLGFGEEHLCSAHASGGRWFVSASCARLVGLEVGDEVYIRGHIHGGGNGEIYAPIGFEHTGFKGFLLYPKNNGSES